MEQQPILLFVGGLPLHACDQNLSRYFRKYGPLDSAEVKRTSDGKSKGYGFVRFLKAGDARLTLKDMNHEILGRKVNLELAKDNQESTFVTKSRTSRKLVISRIPEHTSLHEILASLSKICPVEKITPIRVSENNGQRFCTVIMQEYQKSQDLVTASILKLKDGTILEITGGNESHLRGDQTSNQQVNLDRPLTINPSLKFPPHFHPKRSIPISQPRTILVKEKGSPKRSASERLQLSASRSIFSEQQDLNEKSSSNFIRLRAKLEITHSRYRPNVANDEAPWQQEHHYRWNLATNSSKVLKANFRNLSAPPYN